MFSGASKNKTRSSLVKLRSLNRRHWRLCPLKQFYTLQCDCQERVLRATPTPPDGANVRYFDGRRRERRNTRQVVHTHSDRCQSGRHCVRYADVLSEQQKNKKKADTQNKKVAGTVYRRPGLASATVAWAVFDAKIGTKRCVGVENRKAWSRCAHRNWSDSGCAVRCQVLLLRPPTSSGIAQTVHSLFFGIFS